eukprot:CAMPEP_0170464722 /NCGR_PEP_ID=MMETSP0123-20130129/9336_1 /TAXON_ID=182087 /ORGANISM="Favella ehrenbergii, Strain Fehren 1" /LENGTH=382 /DNA_ID=CAMNT_0010730443 /DNA_START=89 /DNA_END=1239 /DNA_ORIENTATION=+
MINVLGDVPVVDGAVGVASGEDLDVAVAVLDVGLAIVDVVLVQGLLRHHHRVLVQVHVVEEYGAPAERIAPNPRSLLLSEAWIDRALESPAAVFLPLEEEGRVVESAADISVLADEQARQNGVPIVHRALHSWLSLVGDLIGGEVREVHLAVMGCEGEGGSAGREGERVVPHVRLQLENNLASLGCHTCEWANTIVVDLFLVSRRDDDSAISGGGSHSATTAWIESHGCDGSFMERLTKGRLLGLRQGDPEVERLVISADKDVAARATHAELIAAAVPRGEQVCLELFDSAEVGEHPALRRGVPDNNATIGRRRQQLVRHWVPLERVHIAVVLFEDFDESPILDIRLLVGGEDQDLATVGAHSHQAPIGVPRETLNSGRIRF